MFGALLELLLTRALVQQFDDRTVELTIRGGHGEDIAALEGRLVVVERCGERQKLLVREPTRSIAGRALLDPPQAVERVELVRR